MRTMLSSYILILLIIQVGSEWVEISQQHYKKPLRPTHNHPILAIVGKTSETIRPTSIRTPMEADDTIKTTYNRPLIDVTGKMSDDDRVNKRNRIYINHTLADHNWDIDSVQKVPSDVNVKLKSDTKINDKHDVVRKPTVTDEIAHGSRSKGEVVIIRRSKPDISKNGGVITDKPSLRRTTVTGHVVRVRPTNNKGLTNEPKPLDEYKGPIEVLNLSDLEYTTAEDSYTNLNIGTESTVKFKQSVSNTTPKVSDRRKQESFKSDSSNDHKNLKSNYDSTTKQIPLFKGITNIRRVDIIRSTQPTLIEEFDEPDYRINKLLSTPKPESVTDKRNNNKGVGITTYQFPNLGHIKRVHIESITSQPTRKPKPKNKYATAEKNLTGKSDGIENKIRVDNVTIRRSTTEKSFPVRTKPKKHTFENRIKLNQLPTVPNPEDVMLEELIIGEEKHFDIKVHNVASLGTVKRVSNPTVATTVDKNKLDKPDSTKRNSESTSEIDTDEEITVANEDSNIHYNNINKNHYFTSSTEEITIPTTTKFKQKQNTDIRRPEISPQIEKYELNSFTPVRISEHLPEFVTKEDKFGKIKHESTSKSNIETIKMKEESNNQADAKRQETQNKSAGETKLDTQSSKNEDDRAESEDPLSSDRKNNAMETLIKFLKTVTDIITKNTRRGVHGKMLYLEELRDTIMANIEDRLEAEFPDDAPGSPGLRRARSAEPRGHVEFPSSEGALMTISFLTFAVFLIKLVLQVIQAYKNKTMMMMPTVVAAVGRAYNERSNRK